METALLALQWAFAIIAIGAFFLIWKSAWGENWWIPLFGLLIFPLFPVIYAAYAGIRLKTTELKWPAITYAACVLISIGLQRIRLGYWAWPDVGLG